MSTRTVWIGTPWRSSSVTSDGRWAALTSANVGSASAGTWTRAASKTMNPQRVRFTARLADRVEELESKAYDLAGEEFMLGSTQQVARILFEKLGLTPGRKGKTGYSTDAKVLRTIRGEHAIVA